MNQSFIKRLAEVERLGFQGIKRGLEKEALRVDFQGRISRKSHPKALGSTLTHPRITTDYSEALMEFITPPSTVLEEPLTTLREIHGFTQSCLSDELLWPGSIPCYLERDEDVPIAEYGQSHAGLLKHRYRQGLGHRYGRLMQTIAGVHYNFSLPTSFWQLYQQQQRSTETLSAFISAQYLHIIRNARRMGWLIPLLFGASPILPRSFLKGSAQYLEPVNNDLLVGPFATALRLGDSGYSNKVQAHLSVSYNTLEEFVQTINRGIHTPAVEYSGFSEQLSDSILQVEDEHYAEFRPKRLSSAKERMLSAIHREGIEYLEVRSLDVDPFEPVGVSENTMGFLDVFLLTCLFIESPLIDESEERRIDYNHEQVILLGRKPKLSLINGEGNHQSLESMGREFLDMMRNTAEIVEKTVSHKCFSRACDKALESLTNLESLPSAKVARLGGSYYEAMLSLAKEHRDVYQRYPYDAELYHGLARDAWSAFSVLESEEQSSFDEYLREYLAF